MDAAPDYGPVLNSTWILECIDNAAAFESINDMVRNTLFLTQELTTIIMVYFSGKAWFTNLGLGDD